MNVYTLNIGILATFIHIYNILMVFVVLFGADRYGHYELSLYSKSSKVYKQHQGCFFLW